jgi:hypothetical protein
MDHQLDVEDYPIRRSESRVGETMRLDPLGSAMRTSSTDRTLVI